METWDRLLQVHMRWANGTLQMRRNDLHRLLGVGVSLQCRGFIKTKDEAAEPVLFSCLFTLSNSRNLRHALAERVVLWNVKAQYPGLLHVACYSRNCIRFVLSAAVIDLSTALGMPFFCALVLTVLYVFAESVSTLQAPSHCLRAACAVAPVRDSLQSGTSEWKQGPSSACRLTVGA